MAEVGWWAPGQLDAWRGTGDPLADAAVEVLGRIDQQPHMESSLGWIERLTETAEVDRKDRKVLERFVRGVAELPPCSTGTRSSEGAPSLFAMASFTPPRCCSAGYSSPTQTHKSLMS